MPAKINNYRPDPNGAKLSRLLVLIPLLTATGGATTKPLNLVPFRPDPVACDP